MISSPPLLEKKPAGITKGAGPVQRNDYAEDNPHSLLRSSNSSLITCRPHCETWEGVRFYGLVGSGRSRFLRSLIGMEPLVDGSIMLFDRPYRPKGPRDAAQLVLS